MGKRERENVHNNVRCNNVRDSRSTLRRGAHNIYIQSARSFAEMGDTRSSPFICHPRLRRQDISGSLRRIAIESRSKPDSPGELGGIIHAAQCAHQCLRFSRYG